MDRFPDLTFVLDHMGCAVGVDMIEEEKRQVFNHWSVDIRDFARRPNVVCKIGGLGMPVWGFGFEAHTDTVGYRELAAAWQPFIETSIDAFGADRCMMESNLPPDGRSCGYVPLWNALKYVVRGALPDEKRALFSETAARVYRLKLR